MISVAELNKLCVDKIESATIVTEPFAHLVIDTFLPSDFYRELIAALDSDPGFKTSRYAGAGLNTKAQNYKAYGLTLPHDSYPKVCQQLSGLLQSDQFAHTLIKRFYSQQNEYLNAVRAGNKVHYHRNTEFHCFHHVQIDLPGYHIPPHADDPSKIITYLLYLDSEIPDEYSATLLCTRLRGRRVTQKLIRTLGRALMGCARVLRLDDSGWFGRWRKSSSGITLGLQSAQWLPWAWFQVSTRINDVPNRLLVFAPNADSYHAVNFSPSINSSRRERRVARGFVRAGKEVFDRVDYCSK